MDRKAGLSSDNEALDADVRRAHQTEVLRKTVEICWESSDFYRGKLEQAGLKPDDIRDIDDLARIPVTTKKEAMTARASRFARFGGTAVSAQQTEFALSERDAQ